MNYCFYRYDARSVAMHSRDENHNNPDAAIDYNPTMTNTLDHKLAPQIVS